MTWIFWTHISEPCCVQGPRWRLWWSKTVWAKRGQGLRSVITSNQTPGETHRLSSPRWKAHTHVCTCMNTPPHPISTSIMLLSLPLEVHPARPDMSGWAAAQRWQLKRISPFPLCPHVAFLLTLCHHPHPPGYSTLQYSTVQYSRAK